MGTNYDWITNACQHCGRGDSPRHIGKSSGGWCFSLNIYPDDGINDLPDWERIWETQEGFIKDEYDRRIPVAEMREIIRERACKRTAGSFTGYQSEAEFHRLNSSEPGPNGLLRHSIGRFCVKHGEGTWDCLVGDFS